MPKLTVMLEGVELRVVRLTADRTTIGRRSGNDLVVVGRGVSGAHAVVCRHGDKFDLVDMNSTNGTVVNGEPVKLHPLRSGDLIEIGEYRLRFLADDDAETSGGSTAVGVSFAPKDAVNRAPPTFPTFLPLSRDAEEESLPSLRILFGTAAGRELRLRKPATRLGRRFIQLAIVARRPNGCFLSHTKGERRPTVNGRTIGSDKHPLRDGDIVEIAGVVMQFFAGGHTRERAPHADELRATEFPAPH